MDSKWDGSSDNDMGLIKVHHTRGLDDLKKRVKSLSDHIPVTHRDAVTLSFNTLEQCKLWHVNNRLMFNNGFGKFETKAEYEERRNNALAHATGSVVNLTRRISGHLPIHVCCFQEVQCDDLHEMDFHLDNDFKLVKINGNTVVQQYGDKYLLMAHTQDVVPLETLNIDSLGVYQQGRFQAVKFLEKATGMVFVVVNVHQDYKAVELEEKPGAGDLLLIQNFFKDIPCIITGDFNSENLTLAPERGVVILGQDTNIIWDAEKGIPKPGLGACDHIIMNKEYCTDFLPRIREQLRRAAELQHLLNHHLITKPPSDVEEEPLIKFQL